MHATAPLDPDVPVMVAGEPEEQARAERLDSGIPLPETLVRQLRDLSDAHGAVYLLEGHR